MTIGAGPVVVTCCPHLVLPNVGYDDGLSIRLRSNCFQDRCRVGVLLVAFDVLATLAVLSLPGTYFVEPGAMVCRLNRRGKDGQGGFGIGYNRYGRDFDFVHLGGINVYMDDACMRGKLANLASDPI